MKLTPSKALEAIGLLKENGCYIKSTVEYKIVEKALKDSEKQNEYYAKLLESVLNDKEHKALEIIKELFDIEFITIKHFKTFYTMRLTNKTTNYVQNIDIKTKEEFDLLKEELKK